MTVGSRAAPDVWVSRRQSSYLASSRCHATAHQMEILASFPKSFMVEGRELHEQQERDWGSFGPGKI